MKTVHQLKTCILAFALLPLLATGADPNPPAEKKIGVLLVSHGSRSATWRGALIALEDAVRPRIVTNAIEAIKTAFMEYTGPSIATRLKEFDAEGFTDVIIVPVFLTVSPHTFDDIPTIIGQKTDPKSLELLKIENIQRYTPCARTVLTPNLDFPDMLRKNIHRRAQALSSAPAEEGLVLIAYGDETYEKEWSALLDSVGRHVEQSAGIDTWSHCWCGHIAHYDPAKTTAAISAVLAVKKRAIVIPVLVARDEMFQVKIIGDGITAVPDNQSRVVYKPDSILPDPDVEQWVVSVAREFAGKITSRR